MVKTMERWGKPCICDDPQPYRPTGPTAMMYKWNQCMNCGGQCEEPELNRMQELLCEFFDMLDTVEESDSGTEFKPTKISSCRSQHISQLSTLLPELRKLARDYDERELFFKLKAKYDPED